MLVQGYPLVELKADVSDSTYYTCLYFSGGDGGHSDVAFKDNERFDTKSVGFIPLTLAADDFLDGKRP